MTHSREDMTRGVTGASSPISPPNLLSILLSLRDSLLWITWQEVGGGPFLLAFLQIWLKDKHPQDMR